MSNQSSDTTALTIRMEKPASLALDQLAQSTDRSRNWLVNRAIEDYIAQNQWQIKRIEDGVKAAAVGDYAADAEVARVFAKYGQTP